MKHAINAAAGRVACALVWVLLWLSLAVVIHHVRTALCP